MSAHIKQCPCYSSVAAYDCDPRCPHCKCESAKEVKVSESTIEEVRYATVKIHPGASVHYFCLSRDYAVYSQPDDDKGCAGGFVLGAAGVDANRAWINAYCRLSAKPAPEKVCPSCKCAPHGGSCIQSGPLLMCAEQAAPESEDEAFERECGAYDLHDLHSFLNDIAKHLRNARARLDAERERSR